MACRSSQEWVIPNQPRVFKSLKKAPLHIPSNNFWQEMFLPIKTNNIYTYAYETAFYNLEKLIALLYF